MCGGQTNILSCIACCVQSGPATDSSRTEGLIGETIGFQPSSQPRISTTSPYSFFPHQQPSPSLAIDSDFLLSSPSSRLLPFGLLWWPRSFIFSWLGHAEFSVGTVIAIAWPCTLLYLYSMVLCCALFLGRNAEEFSLLFTHPIFALLTNGR